MSKNGLLFGYVCETEERYNGQKIRTNSVRALLEDYLDYDLCVYDTLRLRKNPLSILPYLYRIKNYDNVFLILAHNGVRFLMPLIVSFSVLFRKKIHFVAIGGWLPDFIDRYPYLSLFLKRVDFVFVQSDMMKHKIQDVLKPAKVEVLPNFKFYSYERQIKEGDNKFLRVVYISRVSRKKGLDTVERIFRLVQERELPMSIDLYGPIAAEDSAYLNNILQTNTFIKYNGIVRDEDVFATLARYDVMLFPTHYMTEGFPGVILDAFISGLPIVASNWNYSSEFIKPEFGYIFDHTIPEAALVLLIDLLNDPDLLLKMKKASYNNRSNYSVPYLTVRLKSLGL